MFISTIKEYTISAESIIAAKITTAFGIGNDTVIGFDAHSPEVFQNKRIYKDALKYLKNLNITPIEIDINNESFKKTD